MFLIKPWQFRRHAARDVSDGANEQASCAGRVARVDNSTGESWGEVFELVPIHGSAGAASY